MAAECLKLSRNANDPNNKAVLVDMAATWIRLAEEAEAAETKTPREPEQK